MLRLELFLVFGVVALIIGVSLGVVMVFLQRQSSEGGIPTDFDQVHDYTAAATQEGGTWQAKLLALPLPAKIAMGGVPLLLILGTVVALTLNPNKPPPTPPPPTKKYTLTITKADLVSQEPQTINVLADTDLPEGISVTAKLLDEEQKPFPWPKRGTTLTEVVKSKVTLRLLKDPEELGATKGTTYTVLLEAKVPVTKTKTLKVNETLVTATHTLNVPKLFEEAFFTEDKKVLKATPYISPTTIASTNVLTSTHEVSPTTEVAMKPTAITTPTVTPAPKATGLTATIFNGGNVRTQPALGKNVAYLINANEEVTLLQKTANGLWYKIKNSQGQEGWIHNTLLVFDRKLANQVPVESTASASSPSALPAPTAPSAAGLSAVVFNGGKVRSQPDSSNEKNVVGGINAGDTVEIFQKTLKGDWYKIKNQKGEEGWVHKSLLAIDPSLVTKIPLQAAGATPQLSLSPSAKPLASLVGTAQPEKTGLNVQVGNGGNLREQPNNRTGKVLALIESGSMIELLGKTTEPTDLWYYIRDVKGNVGWVHSSLLIVPPGIAAKVPLQAAESLPSSAVAGTQTISPTASPTAKPSEEPKATGTSQPLATTPTLTPTIASAAKLQTTVYNGGNVRLSPNGETIIDQINAKETVELLKRTADAKWYQIQNLRGKVGWVHRSLLNLSPEIEAKVPVGQE